MRTYLATILLNIVEAIGARADVTPCAFANLTHTE